MKHAYLILAHNNWEQLKLLVSLLDDADNDIYIHIDKKAKAFPLDEIKASAKISRVEILQEYKIYWGSFEMVQAELLLFETAHWKKYDYYHLISGADLPIKQMEYIKEFFEKNNGKEFIHYDTDKRLREDKEIGRRTRLYHFLQNYRRRYKLKAVNEVFTFMERVFLVIQLVLKVNRNKKYPDFEIRYGSQWVSITDNLVSYILTQKEKINQMFRYTNCADELFIQSLVYNSEFRNKLYDDKFDNSVEANMRLIDWKRGSNGNPYVWQASDIDEIKRSKCLFARKFSISSCMEIAKKVI